jgi:N4-gp56 family major capsid protein
MIDYAEKYASAVDERFKAAAKSAPFTNSNYDFDGVRTVNVYGVSTSPMHNYQMTGANRYGNPAELDTSLQALTLGQDRSFTFTIDRRNSMDTMGALDAGKALSRQLAEVVIPEVDRYRFAKMALGAGERRAEAITKANAYEAVLAGTAALTDANAPAEGRVLAVSPAFYSKIKLDSSFVKASELAQNMLISGSVGMVDGMNIVLLPTSYLMGGVEFMIAHRIATTAAQKIAEYKIHDNAPGISGYLVEGRIYHDAFVLANKKKAIYVHHGAIGDLTVESAAGETGKTILTVKGIDGILAAGGKLVYKTGASQAAAALGADVSGWTELATTAVDGGGYVSGEITATAGHKIAAAVSIDDKAYMSGVATVVAGS